LDIGEVSGIVSKLGHWQPHVYKLCGGGDLAFHFNEISNWRLWNG